ncbi:hypothetical protein ACVWZA_001202 [Sphingomonas sp. UYAg733]
MTVTPPFPIFPQHRGKIPVMTRRFSRSFSRSFPQNRQKTSSRKKSRSDGNSEHRKR